jgi:hypothetical protein
VYDPLPETAPLLPAERPEEAPPRAKEKEQGAAASGDTAAKQDEPPAR